MKPIRSGTFHYTFIVDRLLKGLSVEYVDDIIRTGYKDLKQLSLKTNEFFEMSDDHFLHCSFTWFSLSQNKDGEVIQDQNECLRKLENIRFDSSFSKFRFARMRLVWLVNTLPDCLFEIS